MPQEPPHAIANSCKDEPWHAITCGEIPDILRAVPEDNFDEIDRAIVARLQQDGRIANVDLADAVSLSPSACLRRTKALEAAGVIAGYRDEVSRDALGQGTDGLHRAAGRSALTRDLTPHRALGRGDSRHSRVPCHLGRGGFPPRSRRARPHGVRTTATGPGSGHRSGA